MKKYTFLIGVIFLGVILCRCDYDSIQDLKECGQNIKGCTQRIVKRNAQKVKKNFFKTKEKIKKLTHKKTPIDPEISLQELQLFNLLIIINNEWGMLT